MYNGTNTVAIFASWFLIQEVSHNADPDPCFMFHVVSSGSGGKILGAGAASK